MWKEPTGNSLRHGKSEQTCREIPQWALNSGLFPTVETTDPTICRKNAQKSLLQTSSWAAARKPGKSWTRERRLQICSGATASSVNMNKLLQSIKSFLMFKNLPHPSLFHNTDVSVCALNNRFLYLITAEQNSFEYLHQNRRKASRSHDNYFWQYVAFWLPRAWEAVFSDWTWNMTEIKKM